jgi:CRP-like cAMP-binding protein
MPRDLAMLEGLPGRFVYRFLEELMRAGAVIREGHEYRLVTCDQRLPVYDPERALLRRQHSATRIQLVCDQALKQGRCTPRQIAQTLGLSSEHASNALGQLTLRGILKRIGRGRYEISEGLSEAHPPKYPEEVEGAKRLWSGLKGR